MLKMRRMDFKLINRIACIAFHCCAYFVLLLLCSCTYSPEGKEIYSQSPEDIINGNETKLSYVKVDASSGDWVKTKVNLISGQRIAIDIMSNNSNNVSADNSNIPLGAGVVNTCYNYQTINLVDDYKLVSAEAFAFTDLKPYLYDPQNIGFIKVKAVNTNINYLQYAKTFTSYSSDLPAGDALKKTIPVGNLPFLYCGLAISTPVRKCDFADNIFQNSVANNYAFSSGLCHITNGMGIVLGTNNYLNRYSYYDSLNNGLKEFDSYDYGKVILPNIKVLDNLESSPASSTKITVGIMGAFASSGPEPSSIPNHLCRMVRVNNPVTKIATRVDGTQQFRASSPSVSIVQSGCYAINGYPLNNNLKTLGSGYLEYIISKTQPSSSTNGTLINTANTDGALGIDGYTNQDGDLYLRIRDHDGDRSNNIGSYSVKVRSVTNPGGAAGFMGKLASKVIDPLKKQILAVGEQIFAITIRNNIYRNLLNLLLVLYVSFYGIGIVIGSKEIKQSDLVKRLIKVGVVVALLNIETANTFFRTYLFNLFWNGSTSLIGAVTFTDVRLNPQTGQYDLNYSQLFSFLGSAIFSKEFWYRIFCMILWMPIGWLLAIIVFKSAIDYFVVFFKAIITLLLSITAIGLLISLAPIFIPLILFERTFELFKGWLSALVSFAMTPVIYFACIMFLNVIVSSAIVTIALMNLKWKCIIPFSVTILGKEVSLFCFSFYVPEHSMSQIFTATLLLYIFTGFMVKLPDFVKGLIEKLFDYSGGEGAVEQGSKAQGRIAQATGFSAKNGKQKSNREKNIRGYEKNRLQHLYGNANPQPKNKVK